MTKQIRRIISGLVWFAVAMIAIASIWQLEAERDSVSVRTLETAGGDVTLYMRDADVSAPLVIMTHGFAGSRQMMQYISRDLARGGMQVAAFDFYGQGRSTGRMSADVTRIEGTTQQLIEQTQQVTQDVRLALSYEGPVALVGHSMATDIIIRAAQDIPNVAAIVAVSMYSEAVTPEEPKQLLIISGEWEDRLRDVGRAMLAQVSQSAEEGETVTQRDVTRRAVYTPRTEHVAVLFAAATMQETRAWLAQAFEIEAGVPVQPQGLAIALCLMALVALVWPVARIVPCRNGSRPSFSVKTYFLAILLPIAPAVGLSILANGAVLGSASFGALMAFFASWGSTALAVLIWGGYRPQAPAWMGCVLFLAWALGVFALALDRYAAAFLPTGPRLELMAALLVGTVPFMLADRVLLYGAALWQRVLARVVPVAVFASTMMMVPQDLGLLFTVLPVMVLFYCVFGTMGRAIGQRSGPETSGLALGVILAWSIAASTPLFAG
ncbi:MAG: alpha/beta fold hydrolase [Roseobacter sp.]